MTWAWAPWLLAAYLTGAIPTSYLAARLGAGIDLREHGSRNLGATNLYRVLGWRYAIPVGLFDAAKGLIPTVVYARQVSHDDLVALLFGMVAILGHAFSVFIRFKGGKGVATATGVMLGLTPAAVGICFAVWAATLYLSGYVSLASILGAAVLPPAVYLLYPGHRRLVWLDLIVAGMIIWFHRSNIGRLLHGTENRFGRRATERPTP